MTFGRNTSKALEFVCFSFRVVIMLVITLSSLKLHTENMFLLLTASDASPLTTKLLPHEAGENEQK